MDNPILTWLVGTLGKAVVSKVLSGVFAPAPTLNDSLLKAMYSWAEKVTEKYSDIEKDNLAVGFFSEDFPETSSPRRIALRELILNGEMPTTEDWYAAIAERWKQVKRAHGQNATSFYRADEDEAKPWLRKLAKALQQECSQDNRLLSILTADVLLELRSALLQPKKKSIRDVMSICRRMAIFTETDYENSTEAMFQSLQNCRASIQQVCDYVEPPEVRSSVDEIFYLLHEIESMEGDYVGDKTTGNPVAKRIDAKKLEILAILDGLQKVANEDFRLPRKLIRHKYYHTLADAGKEPDPSTYYG